MYNNNDKDNKDPAGDINNPPNQPRWKLDKPIGCHECDWHISLTLRSEDAPLGSMFGARVVALLAQPLDSARRTAESAAWQDFTFHLLQRPGASSSVCTETEGCRHPCSDRLMSCANTDDTWGDAARPSPGAYSRHDPDLSVFHFVMRQAFAQSHGTLPHTGLEMTCFGKK